MLTILGDGTFDANCDTTRSYTNITQILQSFGADSLLSYMQTYWKDYQGNDESFWEHEWGKHGTCINTMKPSCYSGYQPTQEAVDFFQKTVDLFKTLPSYQWLAAAGITPSISATYTSAAIQSALQSHHGHPVTLGCSNGELNEIWYHYNVQGSIQSGSFQAADPDGSKSTCPATGIKYLPKSGSGTPTTTPGSTSTPAPTGTPGTPFSGKGFLNVINGGSQNGCVISAGTWYTTGSCATFTATPSGKYIYTR
jgi:ribonuclease T2